MNKLNNLQKLAIKNLNNRTVVTSNMSQYCMVLTTTDKQEVAEKIAAELITTNLAACVQIDEVKSFYKWEGRVQSDKEFRLMVKSTAVNYDSIEKKITSLSNYELPQILRVDVTGGSAAYLNWLSSSTGKEQS
jgi:periplasmic divalent cation tolerance protein